MQTLRKIAALAVVLFSAGSALAQANLPIYTDNRVNGFEDWSWGAHNLNNASPVRSGTNSIIVNNAINEALSLYHPEFNTSPYSSLRFWLHGGSGGQVLRVQALLGGAAQPGTNLPPLPANSWVQFNIPLATIGAANKSNFNRFWIQRVSGAAAFYVDDIELVAKPAPALVQLSLNATQAVRSVDGRWFGINAAIWDGNFDTSQTISLLNEMGTKVLRFPGGSLSDEYHWAINRTGTNTFQWTTSFPRFVRVATNVNADAFITVNYGSSQGSTRGGQAKEAAAWVAYANASASLYGTTNDIPLGLDEAGNDWRTVGFWARLRSLTAAANTNNQYDFLAIGRTAPLQIKYWEIGNENYGTWETDYNTNAPYRKNEGWSYAMRASNYFHFMRLADPTIKIGVVAVPGESSYQNGYTAHWAVNPRTGSTNYGWTPVMLATLKSIGITPDFAVHHVYPQWTAQESDQLLLQASSNWAREAADLRQQITDYFGASGTNIELVCTENNSNSGSQGRQSTSLVNGLYYADSLAQLMKTEFNAFVWWDLRNGTDMSGSFDPTIYGWRNYGDLGIVNGLTNRHPPFYAAKLMKTFAQPGDTILNPSSDYLLLTPYAARRANGALSLLVLNKDTTADFNAQINLSHFSPAYNALVRSYGIRQDEATRTNAPYSLQDIAVTNFAGAGATFSYTFPRLSLTLLTLSPAAPKLSALPPVVPDEVIVRLEGQAGARYLLQTATNLNTPVTWTTVSTNVLATTTLDITNAIPAAEAMKFWRALWQP